MAEQHRSGGRNDVRFEKVRRHAGAIADIVSDVIGDYRRIARIVFRDSGFDFSDQVGADVGGFRINAAAKTSEDRDQRAPERKTDERRQRAGDLFGAAGVDSQHDRVVTADCQQAEADDEQSGHRAAAERYLERGRNAAARCFGRAQIRANRHQHPDESRGSGERGADEKTDGRLPSERRRQHRYDDRQDDRHQCNGRVLSAQKRHRALLNRAGDLDHPRISFGLPEDPSDQNQTVHDGEQPRPNSERDRAFRTHAELDSYFSRRLRAQKPPADSAGDVPGLSPFSLDSCCRGPLEGWLPEGAAESATAWPDSSSSGRFDWWQCWSRSRSSVFFSSI